ncbi:hypothetical protein ACLKA6_000998 [Drosophila palustris]
MSLPPTLLQRLASRGLLNKQKASQSEAIEEIIAENYDEDEKNHSFLAASDAPKGTYFKQRSHISKAVGKFK